MITVSIMNSALIIHISRKEFDGGESARFHKAAMAESSADDETAFA